MIFFIFGLVVFGAMFGWLLGAGGAIAFYIVKYGLRGVFALFRMGWRSVRAPVSQSPTPPNQP